MAYWWVSQNKTFEEERAGGYLWAPVRDQAGRRPHHWATMEEVRPGDVIFSYVGQQIPAVSVATSPAERIAQPEELAVANLWEPEGLQLRATYTDLPHPLAIKNVVEELVPLLPPKYAPLNRHGTGNQGYLFALPPRAGELLLKRMGVEMTDFAADHDGDPVVAAIRRAPLQETEKQALIKSPVGQGQFRSDLLTLWRGRCCVTGLSATELLRASHSKPWRDSNHRERLDPYNGLLLAPAYDAAFDAGLITFTHDGRLRVSPELSVEDTARLGIDSGAQISGLTPKHQAYLEHHRREVFRAGTAARVQVEAFA